MMVNDLHCFYIYLQEHFLRERETEKCPQFKNVLRTYRKLRKSEELLFWILYEIMGIPCFSANVRQCNIAYGVGMY